MRSRDESSPRFPAWIQRLFVTVGRPLFSLSLILIYMLLMVSSWLFRAVIHSIELTRFTSRLLSSFIVSASTHISAVSHRMLRLFPELGKAVIRLPLPQFPARPPISIKRGFLVAGTVVVMTILPAIHLARAIRALPDPGKLITRNQIVSTKIYDRNGNLLYKIFNNQNRTPVELKDVPTHLIQATVAIEDRDFYDHAGFSYRGILRALRHTLFEGRVEGGSTITQQLVKNALLTREQTLERKIKELILAVLVEMRFSKDEILTMYFNEVGYGGSTYGVEEAAQTYFAKPVSQLTLAEGALLAGLPAAPTRFSPFGTHPELAKFRQHEVFRRMVEEGYVSERQAEQAKAEKLAFAAQHTNIIAPHFVMYVKELLVERFGEQLVQQGGLEVITSLDIRVQALAQRAVREEVGRLERLNITNGAALVTNPQTGEILAMVGSRDYFDIEHDGQVNVTLMPRQPGSAIKPVSYTVALENGMTAATMLSDTPITYHVPGQPPYSPTNYDGSFHGRVSLRAALANSYNVPAVKTLSVFGVEKMIEKGRQMGITTWTDPTRYGLSLTLGGGEVKMTDLVTVYGVLANHGRRVNLAPLVHVSDYRGRSLYDYRCTHDQQETKLVRETALVEEICETSDVVMPEVAFILTNILQDNDSRSPAFGRYSALNVPGHEVAVKTGTTQNLRDNWTIGYTQDVLVAVWVGNNDNSPMSYVASGLTGASPIWNKIMSTLLVDKPLHRFAPPETVKTVAICPTAGTLPCETCPGRSEYFISGTEPSTACIPQFTLEPSSEDQETIEDLRNQAGRRMRRFSFDHLLKERLPRFRE